MTKEYKEQLIGYCDVSGEELLKLKDQIDKIIEIKKKVVSDNSGGALLRQVEDALKTVENMEKIGSKLPPTVDKIKTICQQVRQLLKDEVSPKHSNLTH